MPPSTQNSVKLYDNFENDLFDHHMLISTIMNFGNFKVHPKKKIYRSYKNFYHVKITTTYLLAEAIKKILRNFCF